MLESHSRVLEGKLKNLILDQARAVMRAASFSRLRTRTIKKGKTLCVLVDIRPLSHQWL